MCRFFQNTKATEQIASLLINWIEIVSILSKIAAHFILFLSLHCKCNKKRDNP